MWVVKLGGSLYPGDALARWVSRIADSPLPLVLVPGGGPFADQVRSAQRRWRFGERPAHEMALLAMEQMGLLMSGLDARLVPCEDEWSIRQTIARGTVAVWMPSRHLRGCSGLSADWSVTSDTLSLWLARRLRADGLLIVKSAALPTGRSTVADLQRRNILDQGFNRHAQGPCCPIRLVHRDCGLPIERMTADDQGELLHCLPERRAAPNRHDIEVGA